MPNTFVFIALFGWPLVAAWLFYARKFETAIIWSVLLSFLLLPASISIDLPGIPPLNKETIPNMALLLLVLLTPRRKFSWLPDSTMARILIAMLVIGPFFTNSLNGDSFQFGKLFLRGTTTYDAFSNVFAALIQLVPFLVARNFLATEEMQLKLLRALLYAGLAYSILILIEIRLSPQLHIWIYGYFPHSFAQQMRDGGFRAVVFLGHGLWVAFFVVTVAVATAALWRVADRKVKALYGYATAYFCVVLVLSKSLGSLLYGILLVPLVALTKPRTQVRVAAALVMLALLYPTMRGLDLVPVNTILSAAESIDERRAASLTTRLNNEEKLLEKAHQRPIFGWGGWGRNRIYSETSGKKRSIADGRWVIVLGTDGWFGFIAFFGLLSLPVLAIYRQTRPKLRGPSPVISPVTAGLCLLLAINMVEMIPNATLPPWTWLIAGSLLGYAERLRAGIAEGPEPAPAMQRRRTVL